MNTFRAKVLFPMGVIFLTVIQSSPALGAGFGSNQEAIEWTSANGGNGHWYALIEGPCSSWSENYQSEMISFANGVGAQMVSFNTLAEWEFIKTSFSDVFDESCADDYYIGLVSDPGDFSWRWISGEPFDFEAWGTSACGAGPYPNDAPNSTHAYVVNRQDCGQVWDDGVNGANHSGDFMIEWSADCNNDGIVDFGQIRSGTLADIDSNGVPDCCEGGLCAPDCDGDGTSDEDEIASGEAGDINQNGLPDNCEPDCDSDGVPDFVELESGSFDCNYNTVPDECEIADGSAADGNSNGVIDACELDCNGNTVFDFLELDLGLAEDCDQNRVPDECDIADGSQSDCNLDGIPDSCLSFDDCDGNGVPDECQTDTDQDGSIDACDADDDNDGIPDECDVDSFMAPVGAQYWDPAEGGNGHWYMGMAAPGISWEDAAAQAEALGGYLCTVPSAEENIWVFTFVASDPSLWNTWFGPWIGGYQDTSSPEYSEPDGAWSWVTGESWSYTNWGPGDPSNTNGQDHAAFGGIPGNEIRFTWNDLAAPEPGGFIVEWSGASDCNGNGILDSCEVDTDLDGLPDECDPDIDGDGIPNECDASSEGLPGYSSAVYWDPDVGGNGHWYVAVEGVTSWTDAESAAEAAGGYLATLVSPAENQFVYENLASDPSLWSFWTEGGHGPAIGGVRIDRNNPDSDFKWLTDETWSWTNWIPGGPRGFDNAGNIQPYVHFYNDQGQPEPANYWSAIRDFYEEIPIRSYIVEFDSQDCNGNGILDQCEPDSDQDGLIDECDPDDDNDDVPDECDPDSTGGFDCDANGIDDVCELGDDCNSNLIPDRCESDLDEDGVIDACDPDDDNDGIPDECDPRSTGGEDCDANGVDDTCEPDLDEDGTIDACDPDIDGDGVANECDVSPGSVKFFYANSKEDFAAEQGNNGWRYRWSALPSLEDIQDIAIFDELGECAGHPEPRWNVLCDKDAYVGATVTHPERSPCVIPVIEYTSPFSGDAFINVYVYDHDGSAGDGTQVRLFVDEQLIDTWVFGNVGEFVDVDFTIRVQQFSTIRLAVDSNGCTNKDGDGVMPVLQVSSYPLQSSEGARQWKVEDGGNGHWYSKIDQPNLTWFEARDAAESLGGYLATITSPEEEMFRNSFFEVVGCSTPWIGGYRTSGSDWRWVTDEPWDYAPWVGCGCQSGDRSVMAALDPDGEGAWYDYRPESDAPFVFCFIVEWSADCNNDGIVDYGQILDGTFADEDQNGVPDCCDQGVPCSTPFGEDCNGNGVLDSCELEDNDCNTNGIPDDCEGFEDCNGNGIGDVCDIASGASQDINQDGVPDECQCIADIISDGVVDFQEVLAILNDWGPCGPPCPPDINADGEVSFIDLLRVLDAWGPCDP